MRRLGGLAGRRAMATWPDEVRATPCKLLRAADREHYFEHGYLVLPGFAPAHWVDELSQAADRIVAKSVGYSRETTRPLGQEDPADPLVDKLMLAEGHRPDRPMVTRLSAPVECDPAFLQYMQQLAASVAEDLLGPNVRFHHSKLNFKWPGSKERIHWHQDIQFWPHTNYTPLTIGLYLTDVTEPMGPMQLVPLSVHDELFPLVDEHSGAFTGVLSERQLASVDLSKAVSTAGPRGTLTVHNARMVHSSLPNSTDRPRPLLLNTFASTSAGMILAGTNGIHTKSRMATPVVRGEQEPCFVMDPRPCPAAPDFSISGYKSPFIKPDANTDG